MPLEDSTQLSQTGNPEALVDDQGLLTYRDVISELNSQWKPHSGQVLVGRALFNDNQRSIFVQCGRKWGKTEIILYILWRWAALNPGASCYYISPFQKQSKEIIWANKRVQNFGPRKWLSPTPFNNTELRVNFKNGSFIKCDGSDNYDSYRGISPHLLVMEEYKDHRPDFMEAMRPNLAVFNCPIVFIGTPPEEDDHFYWLEAEEHKQSNKKFYYQAPTWENPHIDREWLDEEKERLYQRGEGDVWEREYSAKRVKGGASKIFPMLSRSVIRPHREIMEEIRKDKRKLSWFVWADPAAASVFGVLFAAVNPYTKVWYVLDEIYEKDQAEMTVVKIGTRLLRTRDELFNYQYKDWHQGYDEAERWFANEMIDHFNEGFVPTHKMKSDKITGLSKIKDILLNDKLVVSDRCRNFYWEMDHYRKDKNSKIPKENDHLIDCFRYILDASYYDLHERQEYIESKDDDFRGARIEDDFPEIAGNDPMIGEWMDVS